MARHTAIRVDNLMYKGCEPHWQCSMCGKCVPLHCYTRDEFEQMCCRCNSIRCDGCEHKSNKEKQM